MNASTPRAAMLEWNTDPGAPVLYAPLAMTEYALQFHFAEFTPLNDNPIVALRGLLGYALLHHLHPGLSQKDPPPPDSPYWPLFKPKDQPAPFLFDAEPGSGAAAVLLARLRVFGGNPAVAKVLLDALAAHGPTGFGPAGRTMPYRLQAAPVDTGPLPWSPGWAEPDPGFFRVTLRTPAQLHWHNVPLDRVLAGRGPATGMPPASALLHAITWSAARRLDELSRAFAPAHASATCDHARIDACLHGAAQVTRFTLEAIDTRRVSTTDGDRVPQGGIQGTLEVHAPGTLARLLACGAATGIGSKVSAGCGRLRLHRLPGAAPP